MKKTNKQKKLYHSTVVFIDCFVYRFWMNKYFVQISNYSIEKVQKIIYEKFFFKPHNYLSFKEVVQIIRN